MKHYIDWWSILFWMIGVMIKCEWKGDFKNSEDMYYWILIHLTYKGKRIK
jgi:hypothetical protein